MTINAVAILREAVVLYRRNLAAVLGVSALLQVAYVVVSILALNAFGLSGFYVSTFASLVAAQLTIGVLTLLVLQVRATGEAPSPLGLLREVLPRTGSMVWLAILVGFRAWFALGIGAFAALLLGGLTGELGFAVGALGAFSAFVYFYVTPILAPPALVARRMGAMDAIRHSTALVKPQFWSVLVVVIAQGAVMVVGSLVARQAAADQGAFEDVFLAQAFITTLVAPLTSLALAETFLELTGYTPDGATPDTRAPTRPAGVWTPHVPTAAAPPAHAQPWAGGAAYAAAPPAQPYAADPAPLHPGQPHPGAAAYVPAQPAPPYGSAPSYAGAPAAPPYGAHQPAPPYGAAPGSPAHQPAPYGAAPAYPAQHPAPPYGTAPAQPFAQPTSPYGAATTHPSHQSAAPYAGTPAASTYPATAPPPPGVPGGARPDRSGSVAPPGFG